MPAVIELKNGTQATYDGDSWESDDSYFAGKLNDFTDEWHQNRPLFDYQPDPIQHIAELAAAQFDAKVVQVNDRGPARPGTVY